LDAHPRAEPARRHVYLSQHPNARKGGSPSATTRTVAYLPLCFWPTENANATRTGSEAQPRAQEGMNTRPVDGLRPYLTTPRPCLTTPAALSHDSRGPIRHAPGP
jgi:hypothetical protein